MHRDFESHLREGAHLALHPGLADHVATETDNPGSSMQIEHDAGQHRFIAHLEDGDAVLGYTDRGNGTLDLTHTFVPEPSRGDGVGDRLMRYVVDHAKSHDLRLVPSCPFARHWMEEHPDDAGVFDR